MNEILREIRKGSDHIILATKQHDGDGDGDGDGDVGDDVFLVNLYIFFVTLCLGSCNSKGKPTICNNVNKLNLKG